MCIKWPNDIYYQNRVKLGGVLVSAFSPSSPTSPTTAVIGEGKSLSLPLLSTYSSYLVSFVCVTRLSGIAKYVRALLQKYELLSLYICILCTEAVLLPQHLGFWCGLPLLRRCMRVRRFARIMTALKTCECIK